MWPVCLCQMVITTKAFLQQTFEIENTKYPFHLGGILFPDAKYFAFSLFFFFCFLQLTAIFGVGVDASNELWHICTCAKVCVIFSSVEFL